MIMSWDFLPWSQRFSLTLPRMRELRESPRSGEKEKPLVTLDLNLTFMQTPGSGSEFTKIYHGF